MLDLSNQKFFRRDFSGQDLRDASMHHSQFVCCNFDKADMTGVDASHSAFVGGTMRRTKCTHTNFAHSKLTTIFEPDDCLGMTITLECSTFRGITISDRWWDCWLYFAVMMTPNKVDRREAVKAVIGEETYNRLDALFKRRQL
jgi:uncharacterized protein YjbI with pentapeptide repeats